MEIGDHERDSRTLCGHDLVATDLLLTANVEIAMVATALSITLPIYKT